MDFWAEGSQWSFIALSYKVWHFWHYLMRKSNCISQRLRLNSYHFKLMPWEYCIRFPHYFQPCRLYQELLLVHYNHKMKVVTFYKGQVFPLDAGRLHSAAQVDRQCPIPSVVAPNCFVYSLGTALPFGSTWTALKHLTNSNTTALKHLTKSNATASTRCSHPPAHLTPAPTFTKHTPEYLQSVWVKVMGVAHSCKRRAFWAWNEKEKNREHCPHLSHVWGSFVAVL